MNHKIFRITFVLILVLTQFSSFTIPAMAAAPANDNFADAQVIASLPANLSVDTTDATVEANEPQACSIPSNTLWYVMTPEMDMAIQVDLNGSQLYGTVSIFLQSGTGFSGLTSLGCATPNDTANVLLEAGQSYYFQVATTFGQAGILQVNMTQVTPPANDNFANAQAIASLPFNGTADNLYATKELNEPGPCTTTYRTLWYSFTPSQDMTLRAASQTGPLALYSAGGPSISNLVWIGCVSPSNPFNFQVQAGQTYYLQVDSYPSQASSNLQFSLEEITPPPNDNFANAQAISSLPFYGTADNSFATKELNEPGQCWTTAYRTLWYSFTPSQDMTLRVSMPASSGNVGVYRAVGPGITGLSMVACASYWNPANFQVQAGQTYYLQADSYGQPGVLQFNLEQIFPPANDNFANAQFVSTLPFSSTVDNSNATTEPGEPQNCMTMSQTVWYAFTAAEATDIRVDTQGSSGRVNVYRATGSTISDLNFKECLGTDNYAMIHVEAGETYYFQASLSYGSGNAQINIQQASPPANDMFANATSIPSIPFQASPNLTDTGFEQGEPQTCSYFTHTVWYSFTPAETMSIRSQLQSSSASMAIYKQTGSGMSDLQSLSCVYSGNPSIFQADAGQTYYLQIGGYSANVQIDLQQVYPPPNDSFADAQTITAIPFTATVDVMNAWTESGEPQNCMWMNKTVWYAFTPSQTTAVRADTLGSTVGAKLNVYRSAGSSFSDLSFVGCTNYGGTVSFVAQAGQTYYLQVGNSSSEVGNIQVNLNQAFPPANDDLANKQVITKLPFSTEVDVTDASTETGESSYCYFMNKTVWYAFTPAETMTLRANTAGSSVAGNVNIYSSSGSGFQNLQFLNCSGPYSSTSFLAEAGKTYYLQAGPAFGGLGTITVNLVQAVAPGNDNFPNAADIPSLPFNAILDLTDATIEANEPQYCYYMSNTAWYSFTATETKRLRADTQGSPVSANVNVYLDTGMGLPGLQFIGCSPYGSQGKYDVEAGQTYYFQVGTLSQPGPAQFNLTEVISITGRVTDAVSGNPLPGNTEPYATADLYRSCGDGCFESIASQQVDGNGRFSFEESNLGGPLTNGSYFITVVAQLYQSRQFGPFDFQGSSLDVGDLPLSPPAVIRGRVVDSQTGNPLSGVLVTLRQCTAGTCTEFVNNQNTDGDGQFRFDRYTYNAPLIAGTYEVEIADTYYQTKQVQVTIADSEDRDLGNVAVTPLPPIGSISGRLVDAVTGKPVEQAFASWVYLYRCINGESCVYVNSMTPGSDSRFRFETEDNGHPLVAGNYRIYASADQYEPSQVDTLNVVENENRDMGDIKLTSLPVRFSEIQPCNDIPASGGDCVYSVRIFNGTDKALAGKVWSMADATLPDSFAGYTNFQVKDAQDMDIGRGNSQVFRFRLSIPANTGAYGTYLCTGVYVGEGNQALLNTVGTRGLFCVVRNAGGFAIASPQAISSTTPSGPAAVQGTETEPNNSCQTAQDFGTLTDPFVMSGNLDSSISPDIDFFHFSGTPGMRITIDLEGQPTDKGTLGDPFLGVFSSDCNLLYLNDDYNSLNSHLEIDIPDDGNFVVAATTCCDGGFYGGGNGSYQLTVAPLEMIGSISGIVTDAASGKVLRGDTAPFAFVHLQRYDRYGWIDVNSQSAGSDGSFRFSTDFDGHPLKTGNYKIVVEADQYLPSETASFDVGKDENYDAGKIALTSYPVRFSDLQTCSVPTDGGQCEFSIKITNGLATKFSGKAWSNILAYSLGSPVGYSNFQTDSLQTVSLNPGKSMVLKFRFQVRGSVPNGAIMCATGFVGQEPGSLFNTVGMKYLFCFIKGDSGFTLTSDRQTNAQIHQMEIHKTMKLNPRSSEK